MKRLKWTIKRHREIVYTGTLKNMQLFTGYAKLVESDGGLYAEGHCSNGVKTGPWRHYHANDQLMYEVTFNELGLEHGEAICFHSNGSISSKEIFKGGKHIGETTHYYENGLLKSLTKYDDEGKTVLINEFYPNGSLRLYIELVDGIATLERYYHPNGALWKESHFERGQLVRTVP